VDGVLHGLQLTPVAQEYGTEVRLKLAVPTEQVDQLRRALTDRTAGRVQIDEP
jgi:hypothetical protein